MKFVIPVVLALINLTPTMASEHRKPKKHKKIVKHVIKPDGNVKHVVVLGQAKTASSKPINKIPKSEVTPAPTSPVTSSPAPIVNTINNNYYPKEPSHCRPKAKEEQPVKKYPSKAKEGLDIRAGVIGGLAMPFGSLKNSTGQGTNNNLGYNIGGHVDFNFTQHHQLRTSLIFGSFSGSEWSQSYPKKHHPKLIITDTQKNNFQTLQVGADWVYNFENPDKGWYTVLGANVTNIKNNWDERTFVNDHPVSENSGTAKQNVLGFRAGAGYNFNKTISLEGTYNVACVNKDGSNGFGFSTANWLGASLVVRF